jgi:hypothetical protein
LSVLLSFGHCVVCSSVFWPLCCLFFCLLAIVLSVLLSFGHCAVCSSVFWPLCCLFFCLLAIVLSVLLRYIWILIALWYLQTLLTKLQNGLDTHQTCQQSRSLYKNMRTSIARASISGTLWRWVSWLGKWIIIYDNRDQCVHICLWVINRRYSNDTNMSMCYTTVPSYIYSMNFYM